MERDITNALIAGFPRCGTTSLFRYLSAHPQVCGSRRKELNFFVSQDNVRENKSTVLSSYFQNFSLQSLHTVTLEASPIYAYQSQNAFGYIHDYLPDAKIIFLLRNPVARFGSYFQKRQSTDMFFNDDLATIDDVLDTLFEYLDGMKELPDSSKFQRSHQQLLLGRYVECLRKYTALFDKSQIFLLFLENLSNEPPRALKTISLFLGIQPDFYQHFEFTPENQSIAVKSKQFYQFALKAAAVAEPLLNRYPTIRKHFRNFHHRVNLAGNQLISESVRQRLQRYYADSNSELREFVLETYPHTYARADLPQWLQG